LEQEYKPEFKHLVREHLENYFFEQALAYLWRDVRWGIRWLNRRINERKTWELKDEKLLFLELHLYVTHLLDIAYNLEPFLPDTAEKIKKQFTGKIKSANPLFPRLR
jgi:methionyl-tRNA synthetase